MQGTASLRAGRPTGSATLRERRSSGSERLRAALARRAGRTFGSPGPRIGGLRVTWSNRSRRLRAQRPGDGRPSGRPSRRTGRPSGRSGQVRRAFGQAGPKGWRSSGIVDPGLGSLRTTRSAGSEGLRARRHGDPSAFGRDGPDGVGRLRATGAGTGAALGQPGQGGVRVSFGTRCKDFRVCAPDASLSSCLRDRRGVRTSADCRVAPARIRCGCPTPAPGHRTGIRIRRRPDPRSARAVRSATQYPATRALRLNQNPQVSPIIATICPQKSAALARNFGCGRQSRPEFSTLRKAASQDASCARIRPRPRGLIRRAAKPSRQAGRFRCAPWRTGEGGVRVLARARCWSFRV